MFSYEDTLCEVIQEHEFASQWVPGIGTESLYKVVQIEASGTKKEPIAWKQGMELFNGKYYTDKDVLYLCIRASGMGMPFGLADLVSGGFVEVVEESSEDTVL